MELTKQWRSSYDVTMMLLNNNATTSRSGVKAKKFSALDGRGWSSTDSTVELILEFFTTIFNKDDFWCIILKCTFD